MRISDWSSDVCSSDLLTDIAFGERATPTQAGEHAAKPVAQALKHRPYSQKSKTTTKTSAGETSWPTCILGRLRSYSSKIRSRPPPNTHWPRESIHEGSRGRKRTFLPKRDDPQAEDQTVASKQQSRSHRQKSKNDRTHRRLSHPTHAS